MKQKILLIVPLIAILLASSCTFEPEVEEPTLTIEGLTEETLYLEKEGAEKSYVVNTNQDDWRVAINASWITAVRDGDKLIIKAEANNVLEERKATLLVVAGKSQRRVDILQRAADLSLNVLPEEIAVDQFGGVFNVDVIANINEWEATVNPEAEAWVHLTPRPLSQQMAITIDENFDRSGRDAFVKFTSKKSTNEIEFKISQSGIMYYIMPYMDFDKGNRHEVSVFEMKRKSIQNHSNSRWIGFATKSTAFPTILYTIVGEAYLFAQVNAVKKDEFEGQKLVELIEMLKGEGFTETWVENRIYYNPEKRVEVEFKPNFAAGKEPHMLFTYHVEQKEKYETFETLPLGFLDFEKGLDGVAEYEKANGGKILDGIVSPQFPTPETQKYQAIGKYGLEQRLYFFHYDEENKSTVERTRQFFKDNTPVFWIYRDYPILTNEFKDKMKQEGYVYVGIDFRERNMEMFVNPKTKVFFGVFYWQFYGEPYPYLTVEIRRL